MTTRLNKLQMKHDVWYSSLNTLLSLPLAKYFFLFFNRYCLLNAVFLLDSLLHSNTKKYMDFKFAQMCTHVK